MAILLVSGATGFQRTETVGHLVVPKQWNRDLDLVPGRWAMDNGCFAGFDEGAFMRMLERYSSTPGCLFATVPDVVGDAAATYDRWKFWSRVVRGVGLPAAFVAQDGIHPGITPEFDALFIGGSTEFKEGPYAQHLCAYAKSRGLWVHWGRVNTKRRLKLASQSGVDSFDGTGFSMFPDTRIPMAQGWIEEIDAQPTLFRS